MSSLIDEAKKQKVLPSAHIMHILAGNIEADNQTELNTVCAILTEAAFREDRELSTHPLRDGMEWCPGCGSGAQTAQMNGTCPACEREKLAKAGQQGSP